MDDKKAPRVEIDAIVPWKEVHASWEGLWRKPEGAREALGAQADGRWF